MAHPLLTAPIGPALLRLAGPTTAVMVAQTLVSIAETYFVGQLGTEALAGFALVFPLMMLMTMMSAGGIGGGIAAAMARAMGGGRIADARALVLHALVLAAGFALAFTVFAWTVAPSLYRLLGGSGGSLAKAEVYSHVLFSGAIAGWAMFTISAVLRGCGDAATPGRFMLMASLLQIPISGILTLGVGSWPGLGMAGPAASWITTTTLSSVLMARALWDGRLGFKPSLSGIKLERRLFWEILRVGLVSSFSAVTSNVTAMLITGLVGRFGVAALAGYGIGVRLEFMLVPLAFGVGAALTTMVGIAAGAGDWRRAVHVAWFGALLAGGVIGVIGWVVAFFPAEWARVFSKDPAVIATTVSYITRVAPFFFLFGIGMTLSFASQGAGRMMPPFAAGIARMIVATTGGYAAVELLGGGLASVFTAIAAGMITFGGLIAAPLVIWPWRGRRRVFAA